jgi:maltose O-acetyltransferase
MLAGEPYDPRDPELAAARHLARLRARAYNEALDLPLEARLDLLRELVPRAGRNPWIEPPFHCDYGCNLELGDDVYFNFDCVVLDVCPVRIGSRTMIGPAVQIYAATHPLDARERSAGLEHGKPVTVGDDVWIGGGTVLCPGVTIGARTVIGAGSVVTRDLPPDVLAAGNPCRILRAL